MNRQPMVMNSSKGKLKKEEQHLVDFMKCHECSKGRSTSLSPALVACGRCQRVFHIDCHVPPLPKDTHLSSCFRCRELILPHDALESEQNRPIKRQKLESSPSTSSPEPALWMPQDGSGETIGSMDSDLKWGAATGTKQCSHGDSLLRAKLEKCMSTPANLPEMARLQELLLELINEQGCANLSNLAEALSFPLGVQEQASVSKEPIDMAGLPGDNPTTSKVIAGNQMERSESGVTSFSTSTRYTSESRTSASTSPASDLEFAELKGSHQGEPVHDILQVPTDPVPLTAAPALSALPEVNNLNSGATLHGSCSLPVMSGSPNFTNDWPSALQEIRDSQELEDNNLGPLLASAMCAPPKALAAFKNIEPSKSGPCEECCRLRIFHEDAQHKFKQQLSQLIAQQNRTRKTNEEAANELERKKNEQIKQLEYERDQERKKVNDFRTKCTNQAIKCESLTKELKAAKAELVSQRDLSRDGSGEQLLNGINNVSDELAAKDPWTSILRDHLVSAQQENNQLSLRLVQIEKERDELQHQIARLSEQQNTWLDGASVTQESPRGTTDQERADKARIEFENYSLRQELHQLKREQDEKDKSLVKRVHPLGRMDLESAPVAEIEQKLWLMPPKRTGKQRTKETYSSVNRHRIDRDAENMHVDPDRLKRVHSHGVGSGYSADSAKSPMQANRPDSRGKRMSKGGIPSGASRDDPDEAMQPLGLQLHARPVLKGPALAMQVLPNGGASVTRADRRRNRYPVG